MHVVSFLALAVQEQVGVTPANVGSDDGRMYLWVALGVGVLALVAALMLARAVIASDTGTAEMQAISNAIREGAEAFLRRQYRTIGGDCGGAGVCGVLWVSHVSEDGALCVEDGCELSGGCGVLGAGGVYGDVLLDPGEYPDGFGGADESEQGVADGAARGSGDGVGGRGAVAARAWGRCSCSLVGWSIQQAVPYQLVGFGFGASLVALFAQLGGGIYTKAADVGADLVGKVEAGIPEDDPRNPAVIADLVGDNVGDCAGRGADIFESTAAENVGAMILGAALYPVFGVKGILFPLIVLAINLIASIVGVFVVSTTEDEDPMHALNKGFYVTSALALAGFAGAVYLMLNGPHGAADVAAGLRRNWV